MSSPIDETIDALKQEVENIVAERDDWKARAEKAEAHERELKARQAELEAELVRWQRIRTPTHGRCCTCQRCGEDYESCRCDLDETADELVQVKAELAALKAKPEPTDDEIAKTWDAEARTHPERETTTWDWRSEGANQSVCAVVRRFSKPCNHIPPADVTARMPELVRALDNLDNGPDGTFTLKPQLAEQVVCRLAEKLSLPACNHVRLPATDAEIARLTGAFLAGRAGSSEPVPSREDLPYYYSGIRAVLAAVATPPSYGPAHITNDEQRELERLGAQLDLTIPGEPPLPARRRFREYCAKVAARIAAAVAAPKRGKMTGEESDKLTALAQMIARAEEVLHQDQEQLEGYVNYLLTGEPEAKP